MARHKCSYLVAGWDNFNPNKDAHNNKIILKCDCGKTKTRQPDYNEYCAEIVNLTCNVCESIHELNNDKDLCIQALNQKIQDLRSEFDSKIENLELRIRYPDHDY